MLGSIGIQHRLFRACFKKPAGHGMDGMEARFWVESWIKTGMVCTKRPPVTSSAPPYGAKPTSETSPFTAVRLLDVVINDEVDLFIGDVVVVAQDTIYLINYAL